MFPNIQTIQPSIVLLQSNFKVTVLPIIENYCQQLLGNKHPIVCIRRQPLELPLWGKGLLSLEPYLISTDNSVVEEWWCPAGIELFGTTASRPDSSAPLVYDQFGFPFIMPQSFR